MREILIYEEVMPPDIHEMYHEIERQRLAVLWRISEGAENPRNGLGVCTLQGEYQRLSQASLDLLRDNGILLGA